MAARRNGYLQYPSMQTPVEHGFAVATSQSLPRLDAAAHTMYVPALTVTALQLDDESAQGVAASGSQAA